MLGENDERVVTLDCEFESGLQGALVAISGGLEGLVETVLRVMSTTLH